MKTIRRVAGVLVLAVLVWAGAGWVAMPAVLAAGAPSGEPGKATAIADCRKAVHADAALCEDWLAQIE